MKYVEEMFCDWNGANRAYNGEYGILNFWNVNKNKLRLSPETRKNIEACIETYDKILRGKPPKPTKSADYKTKICDEEKGWRSS